MAAQQRLHFLLILGLTLIVVLPVLVLTPWLVWRYRYGRSAMYQPEWNFGWRWEIALWGVPTVIAGILAVLLWQNTLALDPYDPVPVREEALHVQAIGFDWKWLFVYPELGIATVDELAFPASRALRLDLTSETVMQSLFIPALGSQIYAMNGMVTHLDLAAYGPGRFRGGNTQYNGKAVPRPEVRRGGHDRRRLRGLGRRGPRERHRARRRGLRGARSGGAPRWTSPGRSAATRRRCASAASRRTSSNARCGRSRLEAKP